MGPGDVWTVLKNSPPLGFGSRTMQPVASRYNDYGIPAHGHRSSEGKCSVCTVSWNRGGAWGVRTSSLSYVTPWTK